MSESSRAERSRTEGHEIEQDLVASARVAHFATADQYARPHVMPVVFVYEHPRLYIPIDRKPKQVEDWRELRRVRNVMTNGRVSLVVDVYDEDWSRLHWVLLEGTAEVIESGEERDRAIAALEAKYPQYRKLSLEGCPVIRVDVERRVEWSSEEGAAQGPPSFPVGQGR